MIVEDRKNEQAVRARAYALAEGGGFASAHEVEAALIGEGWPNVHAALSSEYARKAIVERCAAARTH
ncbi:MAG: hypothetical protein DI547_04070 [Sphingobium sp.]|jgi:hypothetical protein|nr:MAG: hypothetical protein DI547_04070 [Sphingobium sp.]